MKRKMLKSEQITCWADRLYNDNKPMPFNEVLEGCRNVITKFKKQRDELVSFLELDIKRRNLKDEKEINIRLDLINVFNEFLQRKTAKLLFMIIDSHVFNTSPKSQYIEIRKDLISKDFQEFEDIQGYRTKEVDAYFNKILENEDVLMHVNGNEEIVNLLNEKGVGGAFLNVFDPNGERHIEIQL